MSKDKIKGISKAHTVYKLADGTRVPGATTITGLLNKPHLVRWANKLGLEGIDSSKYTDEAAAVGTLAHALVQAHLSGEMLDTSMFSSAQIDLAENAVLSYLEWESRHKIEPILLEKPMVSEKLRYGGTLDCYCMLDDVPTLIDFKTGKAIYDEYFVQTAGYKNLLMELNLPVERVKILRIGRDETEGFEERDIADTRQYFEIFKNLLNVYYLKKSLGWK